MGVELSEITSRHRGKQARYGALLFAAGAVVTVLGLLLPHQPEVDEQGLAIVSVGCALAAAVMRVRDARLPGWAYQVLLGIGTLLISLALLFNGERNGGAAGGDEVYYLTIVAYSAYFFSRRAVVLQVLLIALSYGVTLALIDPGPIAPSRWLTTMGLAVAAAIVIRLLSERIERLICELDTAARTDILTGLPNRRAFEEQFARESARSLRTGRPLVLLLVDVDDFKEVNDHWGHAAGDAGLVAVARVLRERTRSVDTPARIGGDEFGVLLPDTDRIAAQVVAGRVAEVVSTTDEEGALRLTLSVGLAVREPGEGTLEDLIRIADMALYAAKREPSEPPRVTFLESALVDWDAATQAEPKHKVADRRR